MSCKEYFSRLRDGNSENEIVVSTWNGEVDKDAFKYIDQLISLEDPGVSEYGKNWRRILLASQQGINACSNDFVIRSRVEVNILDKYRLERLVSDFSNTSRSIGFPLNVSMYLLSKGMLFCPPDFFQIGQKSSLADYWNLDQHPTQTAPFHMTSGNPSSLCSDQVLGANYAFRKYGAKKIRNDRYLFSMGNWRKHIKLFEHDFAFFDEINSGLDFGRLMRNPIFKFYGTEPIFGSMLKIRMRSFASIEFLGRYCWDYQKRMIFNPYTLKSKIKNFSKNICKQ